MQMEPFIIRFKEALFDTDRNKAIGIIHDAMAQGATPEDAVFRIVLPAIETQEQVMQGMNLSQHFMTAQIVSQITAELIPRFTQKPTSPGTVVIGTAPGDLHALGKSIVIGCLKARMTNTIDLGSSVSAERFVDEAEAHNASVIAISAMMVHTARSEEGCLKVRRLLKERGMEDRVKIVVGGAPFRFDHNLYKTVQADAWAEDALAAASLIGRILEKKHV